MRKAELEVGVEYLVSRGYPNGRFKLDSLFGKRPQRVRGRFPDDEFYQDHEVEVSVRSIEKRWDDPGLVEKRKRTAERRKKIEEALEICRQHGLTTQQPRSLRTPGTPHAEAWGHGLEAVSIDVDAFIRAFG